MNKLNKFLWKFFGAAIAEPKANGEYGISLGRTGFLVILGFLCRFWILEIAVPASLISVFYTFAAYVLGSKTLQALPQLGFIKGKLSQVGETPTSSKEEEEERE